VCSYEAPVRLKKETLREEIRDLKEQLQQSEATVHRLSSMQSSGFPSSHEMMPMMPISNSFDFSSFAIPDFIGEPGPSHNQTPSIGQIESPPYHIVDQWTDVTSNHELIEHLSMLYFRWEYPLFASVSKDQFLADFRSGRRRYCSPLLVNALLAVGCRFSDRIECRSDPSDPDPGEHFFMEAKRLLAEFDVDPAGKLRKG
jgi:hypothetical protein